MRYVFLVVLYRNTSGFAWTFSNSCYCNRRIARVEIHVVLSLAAEYPPKLLSHANGSAASVLTLARASDPWLSDGVYMLSLLFLPRFRPLDRAPLGFYPGSEDGELGVGSIGDFNPLTLQPVPTILKYGKFFRRFKGLRFIFLLLLANVTYYGYCPLSSSVLA